MAKNMAKKQNYSKELLAETDPASLQQVAIGSFLAFFALLGSFYTGNAMVSLFTDTDVLQTATSFSAFQDAFNK